MTFDLGFRSHDTTYSHDPYDASLILEPIGFPLPRASGTERRASGALESPSGHERIQTDDVDVEDLTQMPGQDGFTGPTGVNHKHFLHVLPRLGTGHERPGIRRYISTGRAHLGGYRNHSPKASIRCPGGGLGARSPRELVTPVVLPPTAVLRGGCEFRFATPTCRLLLCDEDCAINPPWYVRGPTPSPFIIA
jgi:hypothetical protein